MSTRNLARTIVEGGRASHFSRTYSTRVERRESGALLRHIKSEEDWMEAGSPPKRESHHGGFADKLVPLRRWLQSHAGKPWNDVYSILRQRFDYRTMKGHHLLDDHAKQFVTFWWEPGTYRYKWRYGLYVGEDGILRYTPEKRASWRSSKKAKKNWFPAKTTSEIATWMRDRQIGLVGSVLFWFIPSVYRIGGYEVDCDDSRCWRSHVIREKYVRPIFYRTRPNRPDPPLTLVRQRRHMTWSTAGYRQDRALDKNDLVFWDRIDSNMRDRILEQSPVAPKEKKR